MLNRYSRQARFAPLGDEGQRAIEAARVAIVGCGALGSVAADLLARAGVARLSLVGSLRGGHRCCHLLTCAMAARTRRANASGSPLIKRSRVASPGTDSSATTHRGSDASTASTVGRATSQTIASPLVSFTVHISGAAIR